HGGYIGLPPPPDPSKHDALSSKLCQIISFTHSNGATGSLKDKKNNDGHAQNIFGEVDKIYAIKWNDTLDGVWHLVDKDENYHNVVYNKDLDQPVIVVGWTVL
ncbi:hypothetical protein D0Y65_049536, partial [Glycine soja]